MRVAAIYDIHGNLPALEAVLGEIRAIGVDRIVVGGDVVPGPLPHETISALLGLDVPADFIQGNGERDTHAVHVGSDIDEVPEQARPILGWVSRTLSPTDLGIIASWPSTVRLDVTGIGDVLFCHATPRSDREIFTVRTPEERLLPIFENDAAALVVCGHTHMQFDRTIGGTRVINAGSVGMPFGQPGAYWALLGPDIELRRTTYDLPAAAARIRASDYPQADDFVTRYLEQPPSEAEMLEIFEGAATRV